MKPPLLSLEEIIRSSSRALVIGVGGGGDVVGALATARFLEFCGLEFFLGGLSEEANEALHAIGLKTELDLERELYRIERQK